MIRSYGFQESRRESKGGGEGEARSLSGTTNETKFILMQTVKIHQAKTHLSKLVERAAKGEAFVIAKSGKPMVKVVPVDDATVTPPRRLGFMADRIKVPDDFDRMASEEIADLFGGS